MMEAINRTTEDILISEVIGLDWACDDVIEIGLRPDHFQYTDNRILFDAMYSQRQKGESINTVDLLSVLTSSGMNMQQLVSHADRLEIARTETRTGASVKHYAGKIIDSWRTQQHRVSVETMLCDIDRGVDWQEAESQHQARLIALTKDATNGIKTFADTTADLIAEMEGQRPTGLATGFCDLDSALGGLRPGNLIVVAGGTGGGKSAFGLCIGLNIAIAGGRVCIVSAEMQTQELHERAAAVFSTIHPVCVRRQLLDEHEKQRWRTAVEQAATLPIFVIDNNRNLNSLTCSIRATHRRQALSLLIVDYAQLIQATGHTREREVATVSASLKGLAADLHIPVIVLAQLNRGPDHRDDKRPRLSDLRESAALSHDADLVLMIHRPDQWDIEDRPGEAEILIRKGRSVDTGIVRMIFRKEFTRFENYTPMADDAFHFESDGNLT
ncbi:MAG: AAA family ATPase [Planctomycetaceae bacterium]|nr:AAA family ATPase [Planctomycetaceae bacterium]